MARSVPYVVNRELSIENIYEVHERDKQCTTVVMRIRTREGDQVLSHKIPSMTAMYPDLDIVYACRQGPEALLRYMLEN